MAQNLGKGAKEFAFSSKFMNDPSARKETMERAFGTLGSSAYGSEFGYQMGAQYAGDKISRGYKNPNLSDLEDNKLYATVTTNQHSYLAEITPEGDERRISNYGAGNPDLADNENVIQEYKVFTNKQDGIRRMVPQSPSYVIDEKGNKNQHHGKTADINDFVNIRPEDRINIKRRMT